MALAKSAGIDVFIELIGGDSGPAKDAVEAALKAGKHVITANKALLAHHGVALAKLAESSGVSLNLRSRRWQAAFPRSRHCAKAWQAMHPARCSAF